MIFNKLPEECMRGTITINEMKEGVIYTIMEKVMDKFKIRDMVKLSDGVYGRNFREGMSGFSRAAHDKNHQYDLMEFPKPGREMVELQKKYELKRFGEVNVDVKVEVKLRPYQQEALETMQGKKEQDNSSPRTIPIEDMNWTPMREEQAKSRLNRDGSFYVDKATGKELKQIGHQVGVSSAPIKVIENGEEKIYKVDDFTSKAINGVTVHEFTYNRFLSPKDLYKAKIDIGGDLYTVEKILSVAHNGYYDIITSKFAAILKPDKAIKFGMIQEPLRNNPDEVSIKTFDINPTDVIGDLQKKMQEKKGKLQDKSELGQAVVATKTSEESLKEMENKQIEEAKRIMFNQPLVANVMVRPIP